MCGVTLRCSGASGPQPGSHTCPCCVSLPTRCPHSHTDDAPAFQRAVDAASAAAGPGNGKAVIVPPGKWTIKQVVSIESSYVVLRGAGADASLLWMPVNLRSVYGDATAWAFAGGFLG